MAIDLKLARFARTGRVLRDVLEDMGVSVREGADGVVCYGVRYDGSRPALNANVGTFNKYEELTRLQEAGIPVPNFSRDGEGLSFPLFGRNFSHKKGADIFPVLSPTILNWRQQSGNSDFYTEYIEAEEEFRVWCYRGKRLAVYRKSLEYPERYSRLGGTYGNGFAFSYERNHDRAMSRIARNAVDAVGYDFGAVDILKDLNGEYHVLEINSAPGQEDVRTGVRNLAKKIKRWDEEGYPSD